MHQVGWNREGNPTVEHRTNRRFKHLSVLLVAIVTSIALVFPSFALPASCPNRSYSMGIAPADIITVDSSGLVGRYSSIAVDSGGSVHISYYDSANGDLKYATNAAGDWVLSTIDRFGIVGWSTSIALDAADRVHIGYKDSTNTCLKYATNVDGSWVVTEVDSEGNVGSSASIAMDSNGCAHISYYDSTNGDLKYATNVGGGWTLHTVDSYGDVGGTTSITVDSANKIHISYGDITRGHLKYATNVGGDWSLSVIDDTCDVGLSTSIAFDSVEVAHVSYYDSICNNLRHATNENGTWSVEVVDDAGNVGAWNSMAIDAADRVHISYYDTTHHDLKYAKNTAGVWELSTIDSYDDVGLHTSIAVDRTPRVHISYYDFSNAHLRYATFSALSAFELANITAGWNLVTVPLLNHGYKASTLGLMTGDVVAGYNSSTEAYDKYFIVGVSSPTEDFDIEPSCGYWVFTTTAQTLSLIGESPTSVLSRYIEIPDGGGWALVGLPALDDSLRASDVVAMYSGTAIAISAYNPVTQTYRTHYAGTPVDFWVAPGDGLWLYAARSGWLTYDPYAVNATTEANDWREQGPRLAEDCIDTLPSGPPASS